MSLFSNLSNEGLEQAQDRLGGYSPFESDIHIGKIKALYAGKSAGGAMSLTLLVDIGGREYREVLWVTNKKGENFFLNKQDMSKKVPLPGFTVADDICLIAGGAPLAEQATEEKVINVYDYEAKKELPKSVEMITAVIGQDIALGVIRQTVNKTEKVGDEYVPTAETRDENFIDKVFHPVHKLTVAEARNGKEKGEFWDSWVERNKGQIRDKRTVKEGEVGTKGAPKASGVASSAAPRQSLFGPKK